MKDLSRGVDTRNKHQWRGGTFITALLARVLNRGTFRGSGQQNMCCSSILVTQNEKIVIKKLIFKKYISHYTEYFIILGTNFRANRIKLRELQNIHTSSHMYLYIMQCFRTLHSKKICVKFNTFHIVPNSPLKFLC